MRDDRSLAEHEAEELAHTRILRHIVSQDAFGPLAKRWQRLQRQRLVKPRGRRLAWGALLGFAVLMLTFWGVYLLSDMHNRGANPANL